MVTQYIECFSSLVIWTTLPHLLLPDLLLSLSLLKVLHQILNALVQSLYLPPELLYVHHLHDLLLKIILKLLVRLGIPCHHPDADTDK